MPLTEEQQKSLSPEERKIYIQGEAFKFHKLLSSLADLPDIFELQNSEISEEKNEIVKKYDKILNEANQKFDHIPKRFRI